MSTSGGNPFNHSISTWAILKVVLVVLSLIFLWFIRDILFMLLVALLLAALIYPFANWLHKRKIPRGLAVLVVYAALFGLASAVLILIIPALIEQVQQFVVNFSSSYGSAMTWFGKFQAVSLEYGIGDNIQQSMNGLQGGLDESLATVFSTLTNVVGGIGGAIVVLVLAFYMVVEEDAARRMFRQIAPARYQPFLAQLFTKMQQKIGAWLRGQIILGLVVGTAVYVGLTILGVPYALLLAIIAGFLEMVPYFGPVIATVPAAIIGFTLSPVKGVAVIALYVIVQQVENHFLVPKIMQKVTGLNPIVSILSLLIGLKIAGPIGAVLAIPTATMVAVFLEELFSHPFFKER